MDQDDLDAQRAVRVSLRWLWLGFTLAVVGDAVYVFLPQTLIGVSIACNIVAALVMMATSSKAGEAESYPRYARDFVLKRFRLLLVALTLFALMGTKTLAGPPVSEGVQLFWALVMIAMPPLIFLIGPGRDAEEDITRLQSARAMKIGYAVLLVAVLVALGFAVAMPSLLMPVLTWGLYAGIAAPIWAYVVLDWWNDRSGDV